MVKAVLVGVFIFVALFGSAMAYTGTLTTTDSASRSTTYSKPITVSSSLILTSYSFPSSTNLTLSVKNVGVTATVTGYILTDNTSHDTYYCGFSTSTTIAVGSTATFSLTIPLTSYGCGTYAPKKDTFNFPSFVTGSTYTAMLSYTPDTNIGAWPIASFQVTK